MSCYSFFFFFSFLYTCIICWLHTSRMMTMMMMKGTILQLTVGTCILTYLLEYYLLHFQSPVVRPPMYGVMDSFFPTSILPTCEQFYSVLRTEPYSNNFLHKIFSTWTSPQEETIPHACPTLSSPASSFQKQLYIFSIRFYPFSFESSF